MALPIILGIGAAMAAAGGIGAGIKGARDTKKAHDTMTSAKNRNEANIANFKKAEEGAKGQMEDLGELEMTTAKDFQRFADLYERIQNKPATFSPLKGNAEIPTFDFNEIKLVSVAAGAFLGATTGGAAGALFGTAAATGTTAAVMALGTASTGTAIASLSGAAATKAALAAIGGGALSVGGGGIALGTTILTASTLGVGLLVGGAIFAFTGSKIKEKAMEAYAAMLANEREINNNISYLNRVRSTSESLKSVIEKVFKIYDRKVTELSWLVDRERDWNCYSSIEKLLLENTIITTALLHKLINTPLLKVTKTDDEGQTLETDLDDQSIYQVIDNTVMSLSERGLE